MGNLFSSCKKYSKLDQTDKEHFLLYDNFNNKIEDNKQRINNVEEKPSTKGTWAEKLTPTEQYGSNVIITNANTIAGKKASTTDGRIAVTGAAGQTIDWVRWVTTAQVID